MSENKPCLGWRYNFKKGTEYCPNADKCHARQEALNDMLEFDDNFYQKVRKFKTVKNFRKCKEYLNQQKP